MPSTPKWDFWGLLKVFICKDPFNDLIVKASIKEEEWKLLEPSISTQYKMSAHRRFRSRANFLGNKSQLFSRKYRIFPRMGFLGR